LIDTTPEFKEMKQRICDHFKVKLDPNEKIRKFLFPSINVLFPFFVFHLYFHTSIPTGSYDNGLNNICPTLITMTKPVQTAWVNICKAELAGALYFQLAAIDGEKVLAVCC
jgi:hypothetical protein